MFVKSLSQIQNRSRTQYFQLKRTFLSPGVSCNFISSVNTWLLLLLLLRHMTTIFKPMWRRCQIFPSAAVIFPQLSFEICGLLPPAFTLHFPSSSPLCILIYLHMISIFFQLSKKHKVYEASRLEFIGRSLFAGAVRAAREGEIK